MIDDFRKVDNIRSLMKMELQNENFVIDKTGVKLIELVGFSFIADQPSIFGKVNEDYVKREIEWYHSQSLKVEDIPGETPAIWKQVADKDGFINSNYGWCIFSEINGNQYFNVLNELKKNPFSRRASMIYTRPSMHQDYNKNGMSDFMCTHAVDYLVRDDKLHSFVRMRSNDAIFGYRNDYQWQKHVQGMLAKDLDLDTGNIFWSATSLHVYERHFDLIK
jgi:thymidylate synthase